MQKIKITKKIAASLAIVSAAAIIAVGGTTALFNDERVSAGNKIEAGKFALKLDNTCHYDGMVCSNAAGAGYVWTEESSGSSSYEELIGKPCSCTWTAAEDSDDKVFFNTESFGDIKPGDHGENTISFHIDDNPGWICGEIKNLADDDNLCPAPEAKVDTTCEALGGGELSQNLVFSVWSDNGEGGGVKCDNIQNGDEPTLATGIKASAGVFPVIDSKSGIDPITDACVGVAWSVDKSVGNIIQTDILTADIAFTAYQSRHNLDFVCSGQPEPEKGALKVNKVTVNGNGQFDFTGDNGIGAFQITTTSGSGSYTINGLAAGTYNIAEGVLPSGWAKTGDNCQGVVVAAGQTAECTITNTYTRPCFDQADVMFVLDRSGSISSSELSQLKTAANVFVTALNPDGGVHMGQSSFTDNGTLNTMLTGDQTVIRAGIDGLVTGNMTNLYEGLNLARVELASVRDRDDAITPDYMIVITDGNPNRPTNETTARAMATSEAGLIRGEGTVIYVVGVGSDVNSTYLIDNIASPGKYYGISDYAGLEAALNSIANCGTNNFNFMGTLQ